MLPVPRTIEASVLTSQMTIAPGQRDVGIGERLLEHRARAAERREDGCAEGHEQHARRTRPATAPIASACSASASARAIVAGAERAADRRGDAAAHRARRQHLHQHDHGEHQRDGGQLRWCRGCRRRSSRRSPPAAITSMAARFGSVSRSSVGNIGALSSGLAGRIGGAAAVPPERSPGSCRCSLQARAVSASSAQSPAGHRRWVRQPGPVMASSPEKGRLPLSYNL